MEERTEFPCHPTLEFKEEERRYMVVGRGAGAALSKGQAGGKRELADQWGSCGRKEEIPGAREA